MSEICKNCSDEIILNFCGNCGQKKAKRIDRNYIKDELQYTVLHMNKGFLYSIKKILKGPGKTAREFVEGNRVNHYKPILLVFVVSGISAFLTNFLVQPEEIIVKYYVEYANYTPEFAKNMNSFITKYSSFMMLLFVPFMAFFTWLTFKKWGYNYYENVVATAYSLVCTQVISILILIPFQLIFKTNVYWFAIGTSILSSIIMIGVFIWFYIDFYNNKSAGEVILRLFIMLFSLIISFVVLMIIIGVGAGIFMAVNGIDPKSYFKMNP